MNTHAEENREKINKKQSQLTVEILFKLLESVWSIMEFESNQILDGFGIVVRQPFDQDLLVGTSSPNLQPLQLQQLLKDLPLHLILPQGILD